MEFTTTNMQKKIMEIIESVAMLLFINNEELLILQQFSYLVNSKYNEIKVLGDIREYNFFHREHWDKLHSFLIKSYFSI
jgi:hypothetical protein